MKKTFITIIIILILGSLLLLNRDLTQFFSSQNYHKSTVHNQGKKGISNEIDSILNVNSVIKPVKSIHLIIYKAEKRLDFFVTDSTSKTHFIANDKIELSADILGTKLYDEAINIPEGNYKIASINKTTTPYILLNFPNEFDISKQIADKRPALNSEISIGINDNSIVLSPSFFNQLLDFNALVTNENTEIIIVPYDFSNGKSEHFCLTCPSWIEELYGSLRIQLKEFE